MSEGAPKATTIDDYIAGFPPDVRQILQELRGTIRAAAPQAEETINYGIPTYKLNGNLVHFAAYKRHIGFYPTPSGVEAFSEQLAPYAVSKGVVKFPLGEPLPQELIQEIVAFRVGEQSRKA